MSGVKLTRGLAIALVVILVAVAFFSIISVVVHEKDTAPMDTSVTDGERLRLSLSDKLGEEVQTLEVTGSTKLIQKGYAVTKTGKEVSFVYNLTNSWLSIHDVALTTSELSDIKSTHLANVAESKDVLWGIEQSESKSTIVVAYKEGYDIDIDQIKTRIDGIELDEGLLEIRFYRLSPSAFTSLQSANYTNISKDIIKGYLITSESSITSHFDKSQCEGGIPFTTTEACTQSSTAS